MSQPYALPLSEDSNLKDLNSLINLSFALTNAVAAGVIDLESEPAIRRLPAFGQRVGNNAMSLLAQVSAASESARSWDYRLREEASISFRSARGTLGQLRADLRTFNVPAFTFHDRVSELLRLSEELLPILMAVSVELRRTGGQRVT